MATVVAVGRLRFGVAIVLLVGMGEAMIDIGKRYHVKFDDCCVEGEFTAAITAVNIYPETNPDAEFDIYGVDSIEFDNGVALRNFIGVSWEEP